MYVQQNRDDTVTVKKEELEKILSEQRDIDSQEVFKTFNYTVHTGWSGVLYCDTVEDVRDATGKLPFGQSYQVSSPTGKDVSQFIPF